MRQKLILGSLVLLVAFGAQGASAQQNIIADSWHVPADMICTGDEFVVNWSFDGAPADSVHLHYSDGRSLKVIGSETSVVDSFLHTGDMNLQITAWRGEDVEYKLFPGFISIDPRPYAGDNVMFLHHSTGRYILRDSGVRSILTAATDAKGATVEFWDHDYHSGNTYTGIIDPDSTVYKEWSYGWEANDITPSGYETIFCHDSAFRDSLFSRHDVIVFKHDHGTGDIPDQAALDQYRQLALSYRDVFDQHPEKLFVYLSGPPRRPEDSPGLDYADRAREFYDWLGSPEYLNGHPNLVFFDLFDILANPDDPSDPERNLLRMEFRINPEGSSDSHPNNLANLTVGPLLSDLLGRLLVPDVISAVTVPIPALPAADLLPNVPNPFNPATVIRYDLHRPGTASLTVFDLSGRLIRSILRPTHQEAGSYSLLWDGRDGSGRPQPSGVYVYLLNAAGDRLSRRMTLVR